MSWQRQQTKIWIITGILLAAFELWLHDFSWREFVAKGKFWDLLTLAFLVAVVFLAWRSAHSED